MNIITSLRKIKKKRNLDRLSNEMELAQDSLYEGMNVVVQMPTGEPRLKIGHHSIVDGTIIFETENGQITIGDRVHIGGNTKLISINKIQIGNDVTIAWDCTIYDHNSHPIHWGQRKNDTETEYYALTHGKSLYKEKDWSNVISKPIVIEDKVWIGFGVTILKGVTIGEGAVIGAGSVVTKNVPAWTVVAGNPAVVVKKLDPSK